MQNSSEPVTDPKRRRLLLAGGLAVWAGAMVPRAVVAAAPAKSIGGTPESHKLPPLPYAESALAPRISAETIALHHGKHHGGYVDKLNALLTNDRRRAMALEELMRSTYGKPVDAAIFNNAAQIWNHTFYWRSMTPTDGGGTPSGAMARAITRDFGDFGAMRTKLTEAATGQFGSGWAWLAVRDGKLEVLKTGNADNPLLEGARPLLTIDVWEHAYYVDYRNRRADYVAAVIDGLLDWRFAENNLSAAFQGA